MLLDSGRDSGEDVERGGSAHSAVAKNSGKS